MIRLKEILPLKEITVERPNVYYPKKGESFDAFAKRQGVFVVNISKVKNSDGKPYTARIVSDVSGEKGYSSFVRLLKGSPKYLKGKVEFVAEKTHRILGDKYALIRLVEFPRDLIIGI